VRAALPCALALALGAASPAASGPEDDALRAGFGEAPLPAPDGGPLAGYGGLRTRRADSVLDAPQARALVLERGDKRLALIAADLLIARPQLTEPLRAHARERGVDAVLLAATHTHSGPGGYLPGWWAERITGGKERPGAALEIAAAAGLALDRAIDDLAPARLGAARAKVDLAENRRFDDGPDETELPLAVLRFGNGRLPVVVATHPGHPIVLSPDSRAYSADYLGPARSRLGERGWRALLLPGALGDQQPKSAHGPLWPDTVEAQREQAREIGHALADAILEAAQQVSAEGAEPVLRAAAHAWTLPPVQLRRFCPLWWAGPLASRFARGFFSPEAPVQVMQAGPAWFVGVPAEPSSEVGSALRAQLPRDAVPFVIAHTNDWTGYVVTAEVYERGGYESCMSFHGPGFGDSLVEAVGATVRELEAGP
jgi:hypothetical protein